MSRKVTASGTPPPLLIGGLEKLSLVDWPGQLCAVVFLQGCAWSCRYCHNPQLIPFATPPTHAWEDVLVWLRRRQGLLDGVVFSGGEPTWQPALGDALRAARALGFKTGLHTGGPSPERLAPLLPLLDWIGFDFKAPFDDYAKITGRAHGAQAGASLRLIREARVPCEVRTTWHPDLLSEADLAAMADTLCADGHTEWIIQRFRPDGCADEELRMSRVGDVPLAALARHGLNISVR